MNAALANDRNRPIGSNRRRGTVVSVSDARCAIEFRPQRCAGCSGHCATGVFGHSAAQRMWVELRDHRRIPAAGSLVWVEVPERAILRGAIAVFGLPLIAVAAAVTTGTVLRLGDAAVAILTATGLALGFLASAVWLRSYARPVCDVWLDDGGGAPPHRVGLLNQDVSARSDARSHHNETGRSRIT